MRQVLIGRTSRIEAIDLSAISPAASQIAFVEHLCQVLLGPSSRPVDRAIEIPPFAGLVVSAEEDAHEPAPPATSNDLSDLASQTHSLPKIWHTAGTLAPVSTLQRQSLRGGVG
jgi:hypothetical protein